MMVRVRFAPSPTGYLHVGGARTALFNWLYARHNNGKFILRIEDTDVERSSENFVKDIIEGLEWLGLKWDEGPYFQSKRLERYREVAHILLESGKAYRCYCSPEELEKKREMALKSGIPPRYDGKCRNIKEVKAQPFAIRFKSPSQGIIKFKDMIRGELRFNAEEIEDFVILRSNGMPTYHLSVVVDDIDMKITHVIRGEDHINNTPKQILLYEALGVEIPSFAHVPLILGEDRGRLSKRHGATALLSYREEGYLPSAMVNFLVRLGWSYGDQEIFEIDELIRLFDIKDVGKSPSVFKIEKLNWLNAEYMRKKSAEELYPMIEEFLKKMGINPAPERGYLYLLEHVKIRAKTLKEAAQMSAFYFLQELKYDEEGERKFFDEKGIASLKKVVSFLESIKNDEIDEKILEKGFREIADSLGLKLVHVAQAVRLALTGRTVSPGIFDVIKSLGVEESLRRIKKACER
jgi:glutamyl-tRNA synthetase